MRGINLFNQLLSNPSTESSEKTPETRVPGRSSQLIEARNNLLLHRFYYKSRLQKKMYPEILSELSLELHLTVSTIQNIIQAESDRIVQLKKKNPPAKFFRETWTYIVW